MDNRRQVLRMNLKKIVKLIQRPMKKVMSRTCHQAKKPKEDRNSVFAVQPFNCWIYLLNSLINIISYTFAQKRLQVNIKNDNVSRTARLKMKHWKYTIACSRWRFTVPTKLMQRITFITFSFATTFVSSSIQSLSSRILISSARMLRIISTA